MNELTAQLAPNDEIFSVNGVAPNYFMVTTKRGRQFQLMFPIPKDHDGKAPVKGIVREIDIDVWDDAAADAWMTLVHENNQKHQAAQDKANRLVGVKTPLFVPN